MGKGDKPRPIEDKERFDRNFERIFGEKKFHGRERPEPMNRPRTVRETGLIEAVCEHGVGHPLPASARAIEAELGHAPGTWGVHGCDGCCGQPGFFDRDTEEEA